MKNIFKKSLRPILLGQPLVKRKFLMIKNHPQVCLFKPEIPQNTGNVGRLCAATSIAIAFDKAFGFSGSDKNLRRAGLDYWPYLDLEFMNKSKIYL